MTPDDAILEAMQRWLERAVIGLNLCPFAKAVHVKGQVRWQLSHARDPADVLDLLAAELQHLAATDPQDVDTTLIVLAGGFADFIDFHALTQRGDRLVRKLGFEGELQLASFHPQFVFAGAADDDVGNCTNRAPWPALHILREASIERAVAAFPDAEAIYGRNIETLESLGWDGWQALGVGARE